MAKLKRPLGCDVQTALCLVHRPQPHARTGITDPRSGQSKVNRRLPQWQLPSTLSKECGLGIAVTPVSIRVFGNEQDSTRSHWHHTTNRFLVESNVAVARRGQNVAYWHIAPFAATHNLGRDWTTTDKDLHGLVIGPPLHFPWP